ncbi:MAG: hypothetical protein ACXWQR_01115 [Ktedonobacterales bacterium]
MPSPVPALLSYLFADWGEPSPELRKRCEDWCVSSPRFCTFAAAHRDKIRKKIRTSHGVEGLRDLHLELDIAHRLLRERKLAITYEAYAAEKVRGPDFTVSYTTRHTFNVEVRRLRRPPELARWSDVLCDKLRQLPPSSANLVVVGVDSSPAKLDIGQAMNHMRALAERKDAAFFTRGGFTSASDFFRVFYRLSGVMRLSDWETLEKCCLDTWVNAQAKHPIAPNVLTAVVRALASVVA